MDSKDESISSFFCVPDITGFTKFIASAEINFSRSFISGLLAKLVSANVLKMHIAEIEGDAIFFYKLGRLPSIRQVSKQCENLFNAFYSYLEDLKIKDPENYEKYFLDGAMGLKIIIHAGEIIKTKIHGRTKLIGEDVIIVHKLLKNSIKDYEYILLTEKYLKRIKLNNSENLTFNWKKLKSGKEEYDHLGEVNYKYLSFDSRKYPQLS